MEADVGDILKKEGPKLSSRQLETVLQLDSNLAPQLNDIDKAERVVLVMTYLNLFRNCEVDK